LSLTEKRNPASRGIEGLETGEVLERMHREDRAALRAVKRAIPQVKRAVAAAVKAIRAGGKVVYAGAGTSGRLGVLDAAEIPPTFGVDAFRAVIAGGAEAVSRAVEGAEDDRKAGRRAGLRLRARDMALGISASGATPFVLAFLEAAGEKGAACWLMTCNRAPALPFLDGSIELLTGPELIAGSTRLKAATATKLALNMLSTAAMIRLGGVHDGLMVDVAPSNRKLVARAERIVMEIAGCDREAAARHLALSGMRTKVAAVMAARGVSRREAESLLRDAGGFLGKALARRKPRARPGKAG